MDRQGGWNHQEIFMDMLVDGTAIVNAQPLNAATPIACTIATQPDCPRNVTITVTDGDASISAFQIDIVGTNSRNVAATERFVFAGGLTQIGNVCWSSITSVTVTSITGAGAGDTLTVGMGSKIGLANLLFATTVVYKVKKNNADLAAASYTVSTTYSSVDIGAGVIAAGDDYTVWYGTNG